MNEEQYSIACLIVGILSCVLCCMCFGLPLGLSILGFILSIVAAFIIIIGLLSSYDSGYSSYRDNSNPFEYFIEEYGDSLDYDDSDEYQNLPYYFDENEDEQINEL